MAAPPFVTQDLELLREIQAAAEQRLEAQLTAALAADQRALIFAGFIAAAAAALASAAVSTLTTTTPDTFLGKLALAAAVGMIVAMSLAVQAARPSAWYFPGGSPSSWTSDIALGKSQAVRLQELAVDYDHRIVTNETLMAQNARLLRVSALIASFTLLISSIILAMHIW